MLVREESSMASPIAWPRLKTDEFGVVGRCSFRDAAPSVVRIPGPLSFNWGRLLRFLGEVALAGPPIIGSDAMEFSDLERVLPAGTGRRIGSQRGSFNRIA